MSDKTPHGIVVLHDRETIVDCIDITIIDLEENNDDASEQVDDMFELRSEDDWKSFPVTIKDLEALSRKLHALADYVTEYRNVMVKRDTNKNQLTLPL
jgi:hypothetical protein